MYIYLTLHFVYLRKAKRLSIFESASSLGHHIYFLLKKQRPSFVQERHKKTMICGVRQGRSPKVTHDRVGKGCRKDRSGVAQKAHCCVATVIKYDGVFKAQFQTNK